MSTTLPYPCFERNRPVDPNVGLGLVAVGRCRIHPGRYYYNDNNGGNDDDDDVEAAYRAIVAVNEDQAHVDIKEQQQQQQQQNNDDDNNDSNARKKLKKKYMKEGVSKAQRYLTEALRLDVSIVDVEVVLDAADIIKTNGCLAACFLDAGCQTVVVVTDDNGNDVEALEAALDAAQIPPERLSAHFVDYHNNDDGGSSSFKQHEAAILSVVVKYCRGVSVEFTNSDDMSESVILDVMRNLSSFTTTTTTTTTSDHREVSTEATDATTTTTSTAAGFLRAAILFRPSSCVGLLDDDLALMVGDVSRAIASDGGKTMSSDCTVGLLDPTAEQMGVSYAACMKTDRPDNLYTTVVCTRNNEALGLVYSSPDSICAALKSARGVYHSRSRGGLWRKGDTSGNYQTLHRLDVDCDGDALRFTVSQRSSADPPKPAFCHLLTLSCWGKTRGLRHLEETLADRVHTAPVGSYTKRLLDDPDLLRDKLVEEAQELAEAETPQHVAEELADVLYFAMVRAAAAGVSLDDAAAELDRRSRKVTRRKGDSKAFRIAAGQAILDKKYKTK